MRQFTAAGSHFSLHFMAGSRSNQKFSQNRVWTKIEVIIIRIVHYAAQELVPMGKDLGREKEVALLEPQLPPEPSILVFLTIL